MSKLGPDQPLPPLRARLEAVPAEEEGAPVFVLRDLEELSDKPLALSAGGMLLLSLLDGRRGAREILELFKKSTGTELELQIVLDLVNALNDAGYLETPETEAKRRKGRDHFRAQPKRHAAFSGLSYPADALELAGTLGRFFTDAKGPGKPKADEGARPSPLGLIAPHIDFPRGGPSYAWAYQALSERRPPDVVVSLGVAHVSPDSPWIFTPKPYLTPYGPMEVDEGLYDALASKLWYDPRADEWAHKGEHSLEFQAVWLRYLWRERAPKWVPILVSSFERFSEDEAPSKVPTVEKAIKDMGAALREELEKGRRVLVLAGIDLAHVGPRFGDEIELTPELEKKIEEEDRKSLVDGMALDADGFYRAGIGPGSWRKVCGLSAGYTALRFIKALGGSSADPGRLLSYGQAPDPAGGIVSFASAIYDPK